MAPREEKDFLSEFRGIKTSVMRWVWTLILGAFALGGLEANLMWRIYNLESWKAERVKPIEEYYKDQQALEGRLRTLEINSNNNADSLRDIKSDLKSLSGKLDQYIFRGMK